VGIIVEPFLMINLQIQNYSNKILLYAMEMSIKPYKVVNLHISVYLGSYSAKNQEAA